VPCLNCPFSSPFLASAVDANVVVGILTGYVDHSAGVGGRLRRSDVNIDSKFHASPSQTFWGNTDECCYTMQTSFKNR